MKISRTRAATVSACAAAIGIGIAVSRVVAQDAEFLSRFPIFLSGFTAPAIDRGIRDDAPRMPG